MESSEYRHHVINCRIHHAARKIRLGKGSQIDLWGRSALCIHGLTGCCAFGRLSLAVVFVCRLFDCNDVLSDRSSSDILVDAD